MTIAVSLTGDEYEAVEHFHLRRQAAPLERMEAYTLSYVLDRITGSMAHAEAHPAILTLQNDQFQMDHPFARIDFLPAVRILPSSDATAVNLSILSKVNAENERKGLFNQILQSQTNGLNSVTLPDVSSYLATLDYQSFLATRQELPITNEYELIKKAFGEATGKRIGQPVFNPDTGQSGIFVETPAGVSHAISRLSSGEKGLLGLMYFVRRLSGSGGVLLVDEPELHLHPTLQAALFESMKGLADRAQVISVSHSVNLISTSPISGMVQLNPPSADGVNQAVRLTDDAEKADLMATLGISPASLLQCDGLLVVEGETDAKFLRAMFPVELGRLYVLVAGSSKQVLSTHRTLSGFPPGIPWLCLVDRDLATDIEIEELEQGNDHLYVWRRREIESYFLEPKLIHSLLLVLGRSEGIEAVSEALQRVAQRMKEDVLEAITDREVRLAHPAPGPASQGNKFERMRLQYAEYAKVNQARSDLVLSTAEKQRSILGDRWAADWQELVDPKKVLAALNVELGILSGPDALKDALSARARDQVELRAPELESFRLKLVNILDGK
ncbi:AAA family ATPase [Streptomyces sp. ERV7]|uniref:AAA family ATPase n=1 Tax=Streptomyces sp. ERV7 TaxID=1322334 RepID=UPI001F1E20CC|nr:AAA family ATPase [Streptomyces sp. ERV7]